MQTDNHVILFNIYNNFGIILDVQLQLFSIFGTGWTWMVNDMATAFYPWKKNPGSLNLRNLDNDNNDDEDDDDKEN